MRAFLSGNSYTEAKNGEEFRTRSGSRRPFLVSRPLSGKGGHVAVPPSPKNGAGLFPITPLKPPADPKQNPPDVAVDDTRGADGGDSLLGLSRHL